MELVITVDGLKKIPNSSLLIPNLFFQKLRKSGFESGRFIFVDQMFFGGFV
jgi:hypothetical protein